MTLPAEFFPLLERLSAQLGKQASMMWLDHVCACCEKLGRLYGGPEVLLWWLVQRTQPGNRAPLRLSHRGRVSRFKPRRLRRGWAFDEVCSYLSMVMAEHGVRVAG